MKSSGPDYSKYNSEQLRDALAHIDTGKYPNRTKEIEKLLSEKGDAAGLGDTEYSARDRAIFTVLGGELLFWLILGVAVLLGFVVL